MSENKGSNSRKIIKGPSLGYTDNLPKREMWKEISKELDGEFKIKHTAGHDLEMHNVSIPHDKWNIMISVSDSRPLKFIISFQSSQDFSMRISQSDFIDRILHKFRKPGIEFGLKPFNDQYSVKTNRSDLVKRTMTQDVQKIFLKYNIYSLSYHTISRSGTSELISVIQRGAGNKEMVLELINMFKLLIDNLKKSRVIR